MASSTKLTAVNRILSNIGQAPVNDLEGGNPMVEMAEVIIDEVSHAVQSEGWVFNTEYGLDLQPESESSDVHKRVRVPVNACAIDSSGLTDKFLIMREGFLYDKAAHRFIYEDIRVDIVWTFSYEDLPEPFKHYVTIRAANIFAGRAVGSTEAVSFGQREEMFARASAIEYDTQQGDYNIFQNKDGYTTIPTYSTTAHQLRY